jgi:hypothetical protein
MALFARRRLRARAEKELQFHLRSLEERKIESGVQPAVARAQGRREFGNRKLIIEQTLDSCRESTE